MPYPDQKPRDQIALALAKYYTELAPPEEENRFSVSELMRRLADPPMGGGGDKFWEQEAVTAHCLRLGLPYIPDKPPIPWRAIARALDVHPGSSGGYLVGAGPRDELTTLMQPFSVVAEAGVRLLDAPSGTGDFAIPIQKTAVTGTWLGPGGTSTASDTVLGTVSVAGRTYIVTMAYSRQLHAQAGPLSDRLISAAMMNATGTAIDSAVFTGAGGAEPIGLLHRSDITPTSGTTLSFASIVGMKKAVLLGGARESRLRWIAAPDVQETLSKREKASGSGFIWADGRIADVPAIATSRVPAGYLVLADWSTLAVAFWRGGPTIEVDRSGGFNTGTLTARVLVHTDVAFTLPGAVAYASSVT